MRLLVTTTLNPNQLIGFLQPILAVPEVAEIILVADTEPPPLSNLRPEIPSPLEQRLAGRAASKLYRCIRVGRRLDPAWVLSYSLMPHALNGLVAAHICGARTMYHMISGEVEWVGGGWQSENAVLGRLPRPVPILERALLAAIRRVDVVCTMGTRTRRRLLSAGLEPERVVVTPPSIDAARFSPPSEAHRPYDLVTAGRLVRVKRLSDFIQVVRRVREKLPRVRAAIAGSGPLEAELRQKVAVEGLSDAIEFLGSRSDIDVVYKQARIFVLTSESEGLSSAMTEAMASGLPAVVTDIGDLRDLVQEDVNGYLLPVGDVEGFAERIVALLADKKRLIRASEQAHRAALQHSSVQRLSEVYRRVLLA